MEVNLYTSLFVMAFCLIPCSVTSLSNASLTYHTAQNCGGSESGASDWRRVRFQLSGCIFRCTNSRCSAGLVVYRDGSVFRRKCGSQKRHPTSASAISASWNKWHTWQPSKIPSCAQKSSGFITSVLCQCRTRLFQGWPTIAEASNALTTYGKADTDWMGSHVFRDDPSLYAAKYADEEVPGFAFDPTGQDQDMDGSPITPKYGKPHAKDWWESSDSGLRQKMIANVSTLIDQAG